MSQVDDQIAQLKADVEADTSAVASATAVISGISKQISDAVAAAFAAGATPEQLQALSDVDNALKANTASLAAAVAANTPAAPTGAGP